jgi:hypothetical protein
MSLKRGSTPRRTDRLTVGRNVTLTFASLSLKMLTVMQAETLKQLQYTTRLKPESINYTLFILRLQNYHDDTQEVKYKQVS